MDRVAKLVANEVQAVGPVSIRPTLSSWMDGARVDHPLCRILEIDPDDVLLDVLDDLLSAIEAGRRPRWEGKRRDFRRLRSLRAFYDLRAELLIAAWLDRRGVPFAFGTPGRPEPDLVLQELALGMEVTRRASDPIADLQRELMSTLIEARQNRHVSLTFSARPFAIRESIRQQVINEVVEAAARGDREVRAVVRPPRDDQPAITLAIRFGGGRLTYPEVRWKSGPLLTPVLSDAEDALVAVMGSHAKHRQGTSMPTVLVVDLSGVPDAWLRPNRIWAPRLAELLQPFHAFVGLAVMVAGLEDNEVRLALGVSAHADRNVMTAVSEFGRRLGLSALPQ